MSNRYEFGFGEPHQKTADALDEKEKEGTGFEGLTPEQIAQYEAYVEANPESLATKDKREGGREISEFEAMADSCELEYPIKDLYLILVPEEAQNNPERAALKERLGSLLDKLNILEKETDISLEKLAELKLRYKAMSNAVGIINGDMVDHNR
jgi:hypothetical protein